MRELRQTETTTVKRIPERGSYDREVANSILAEALVCHVGFGYRERTLVLPMAFVRFEDSIFLHGAVAGRFAEHLATGVPICVTVTLLDGLVLARSVFSHSMNYRSVVAIGQAALVDDSDRKLAALEALTEHLCPGRWTDARRPTQQELNATALVEMPLDEASVKIRSGPPGDLAKDMDLTVWSGVVPLSLSTGAPIPDPTMTADTPVPDYLNHSRYTGL